LAVLGPQSCVPIPRHCFVPKCVDPRPHFWRGARRSATNTYRHSAARIAGLGRGGPSTNLRRGRGVGTAPSRSTEPQSRRNPYADPNAAQGGKGGHSEPAATPFQNSIPSGLTVTPISPQRFPRTRASPSRIGATREGRIPRTVHRPSSSGFRGGGDRGATPPWITPRPLRVKRTRQPKHPGRCLRAAAPRTLTGSAAIESC